MFKPLFEASCCSHILGRVGERGRNPGNKTSTWTWRKPSKFAWCWYFRFRTFRGVGTWSDTRVTWGGKIRPKPWTSLIVITHAPVVVYRLCHSWNFIPNERGNRTKMIQKIQHIYNFIDLLPQLFYLDHFSEWNNLISAVNSEYLDITKLDSHHHKG